MGKVAGVKFERNSRGKATKITVDLSKWGEELQDFLDHIAVLQRKSDAVYSFDKVVKQLDKKHGVKRTA